jgi:predicted phosphodiesterase
MKLVKLLSLFVLLACQIYSSTKFIVVGDFHYYSPSPNFKESILYEITLAAIEEKIDFVFFVGDLVLMDYPEDSNIDSLLSDWKFVLDTLYENGIKVYACRGNFEASSQKTWEKLFSGNYALPDNGPVEEKFYTYSFEYDDLLFLSLDQYTEYHKINQEWLEEQLENNNKPFVFAASHEPAFKVYRNGLAAFPDERNSFWKSFSDNKGKIYFCGHDHFYDHSVMLDEDSIASNDVHHIVVGTGGGGFYPESDYDGDNGYWMPTKIYHENSFGYLLVEVDKDYLRTMWKHRVDKFDFIDGGDDYNYLVTSTDSKYNLVSEYFLNQNYPNPFNPSTKIKYSIPKQSFITLKIYNMLGKEIETLVNEEKPVGNYEIKFNAASLSSGVYFYRLQAGNFVGTKKMIRLR